MFLMHVAQKEWKSNPTSEDQKTEVIAGKTPRIGQQAWRAFKLGLPLRVKMVLNHLIFWEDPKNLGQQTPLEDRNEDQKVRQEALKVPKSLRGNGELYQLFSLI